MRFAKQLRSNEFMALIIEGDSRGLRDAIAAGEPTIPPMARSPFSNTLPDYIVTGPDFQAKGYGGILAAGFFTPLWAVAEASSFLAMDCKRSSHEEKNQRVVTGDASPSHIGPRAGQSRNRSTGGQ